MYITIYNCCYIGAGINKELKQCFPKQPCGKTCEEYCVGHINNKWGIRTSCECGACCCINDGDV